jgi:hypothetical protein
MAPLQIKLSFLHRLEKDTNFATWLKTQTKQQKMLQTK